MRKQEIIQSVIDVVKGQTYLEIGVQRGKNFFAINAPFKIAVDPGFKFSLTRRLKHLGQLFKHSFIEKTSNDFFDQDAEKLLPKGLDVSFIDGLHTYEQSLLDFENSLKYLNEGGVILFHDCNPLTEGAGVHAGSPEDARDTFSKEIMEWNGDVWKTIVHIRSRYSNLNVFVFDCDHGVGVVYRSVPDKKLSFTRQEIENLTFSDFDSHRSEWLNLRKPEYLKEFLKKLESRAK
jgi:hypothetical protein